MVVDALGANEMTDDNELDSPWKWPVSPTTVLLPEVANKRDALELAKVYDLYGNQPEFLVGYFNAARKPLEEAAQEEIDRLNGQIGARDVKIQSLQQQLLATQEAYQRVAQASKELLAWSIEARFPASTVIIRVEEALANPPSLEALEKAIAKERAQTEIDILEGIECACKDDNGLLSALIAERKQKLEELK